jgi:hypothetical protein
MDDISFQFNTIESKKNVDVALLIYDSDYFTFLKLTSEKYFVIDSFDKITSLIKDANYTFLDSSISKFEDFLNFMKIPDRGDISRKIDLYNHLILDQLHYGHNVILVNCSSPTSESNIQYALNERNIKLLAYDPLKLTISNYLKTLIENNKIPLILNCTRLNNTVYETSYTEYNRIPIINISDLYLRNFITNNFSYLTYSCAGIKKILRYYSSRNIGTDEQDQIDTKNYTCVPLMSDAIGVFSRCLITSPWSPPAGFSRGKILNQNFISSNNVEVEQIIPNTPSNLNNLSVIYDRGINLPIKISGDGGIIAYYFNSDFSGAINDPNPLKQSITYANLIFNIVTNIKSILASALFEQNDEQLRNIIKSKIQQYLVSIKLNEGIEEFSVVCDASNNNIVDITNRKFTVDIFIKPSQSINFVELSFTT